MINNYLAQWSPARLKISHASNMPNLIRVKGIAVVQNLTWIFTGPGVLSTPTTASEGC
jgi:hypothetical protein